MSDLNEQLRAAFEALIAKDEVDHVQRRMLVRDDQGYYLDDFTAGAWWAWQRATPAPQAAPSDEQIDAVARRFLIHGVLPNLMHHERLMREFARAILAAAPAVAITQAATSEPVEMPQVELDASLDTWMDVEPKDVPTWQRKGFNVRTLYAAPAAHLAGTTPNTEAPSVTLPGCLADRLYEAIEIARDRAQHAGSTERRKKWEATAADLRAALSAQQAGVQEAPSEDAKDALAEMEARKDDAYLERNRVVAALAKCFPSGLARTAIEGWSDDWHGCVYIDLPTGQVSWHFHDSQAYLFDGLPPYAGKWDGHYTDEKYRRLAALPASLTEVRNVPMD